MYTDQNEASKQMGPVVSSFAVRVLNQPLHSQGQKGLVKADDLAANRCPGSRDV